MTEWRSATLGEALTPVDQRAGDTPGVVLSVTERRGVIPQTEVFKKRIATDDVSTYKVLRPLDVAFNPYLVWAGAVGQWKGSEPGVTSPVYEVFRPSAEVEPRYPGILLESGSLTPYFEATASGTVQRRRRTTRAVFLEAPIVLPPRNAQRRIVDLVAALDANITALQAETADMATALEATLDLSFPDAAGVRPLGELVTARSGPSWAASDETSEPVTGATPVVKITNTRPDGSFDTNQLAYVRGLPPSTTTLNPLSIVVIRTNGNRARIGNAYLPPEAVFGSAVSAFQFHIEVTDPGARDYVYWFLRAPRTQAAMSEAASGTTGLGNLALKTVRALDVPWPDEPTRHGACATLRRLQDAVDCLQTELGALRGVKAALLPALLSGHLEVPESYDELVGAL